MARDLGQDLVLGEQRHDDELRKEAALDSLEHPPGAAAAGGLLELDRPDQSEAAYVLDDPVALDQRARPLEQQLAHARGPLG